MRFKEFREKYDKFGAYTSWSSVHDAKFLGWIPEAWHDVFSDTCECGSENIISSDLKRWTCCDPYCPIKESYKLAEMFSRAGVLGLGFAKCNTIYHELLDKDKWLKEQGKEGFFQMHVFTEVLLIPWDKYPTAVQETVAGIDFFNACFAIRTKRMTFAQMVGILGLKGLGSNSDRLLSGINSFTELRDAINADGGIFNFCAKHGVSSLETVFNFSTALREIAVADLACQDFRRQEGMLRLNVCMTGRVAVDGVKMTKEEFVNRCNDLCIDDNGVQLLELKNSSGPVTVPFVLYTNASSDHKFNVGSSRGIITDEFGTHSVLMTETDFYNWLKGAILEWNTNLKEGKQQDWLQILSEELKKTSSTMMNSQEKMISQKTNLSMTAEPTIQRMEMFQQNP